MNSITGIIICDAIIYSSIFIIPMLISSYSEYKKGGYKDSSLISIISTAFILFIIPFVSVFISLINNKYNIQLLCATIISALVVIVLYGIPSVYEKVTKKNSEIVRYTLTAPLVILILNLLIHIYNNPKKEISFQISKDRLEEIEVDSIKLSLTSIKSSFDSLLINIEGQSAKVENQIGALLYNVSKKNQEINELNEQIELLKTESNHYETLNSLSKAQSKTIVEELNRNKYLDYFIGGIMGFLTSFLVAFISSKELRQQLKTIGPKKTTTNT